MGQSYRIRTELGINKSINVELNQDYEFLEILSLKIQQADVFTRSCSEYGVVVGRVTANNGFGIPNAKVSIFIPVSDIDLSNPVISAIYPYRNITDVNEDGYRYNLLPYEKSYSKHAATGTFPSRNDALTNSTVIEIIDKYYKFTVKTNESGDYMIMGVPTGYQTIVMDLDLSDMGEFSLTPQDLIRMGRASEGQVNGSTFKTSTDLNSLPQIVSINKTLEVSPLWGEPDICLIAVNRVDFDLRDDANIDIQPNAIFMGSMFSNTDKYRVRKNCRPRDNTGELCSLQSGPGQILAIRQTIRQDGSGNPILEQYQLENSGNVIDEDGTWLFELPMNLDYIITNEFGERVISPDPTIGIPTKGKYRFKIKWQQSKELTLQTRRAYFIVPNVREYGWDEDSSADPYLTAPKTSPKYKQLRSSYYFGVDWSGYTNGFDTSADTKSEIIINCEDSFYQMSFNKVYSVSSLIDQYKKGNRARFIGIKEIDDDDCADSVNKFPVNEGYRNYDTIYFIFALLLTYLQYIGSFLLVLGHLIIGTIYQIIRILSLGTVRAGGIPLRLPMITYPECENCECKPATAGNLIDAVGRGTLTPVSTPTFYYDKLTELLYGLNYQPEEDIPIIAELYSQAMGGNISSSVDTVYKVPKSDVMREVSEKNDRMFVWGMDLPLGERINIFNQRSTYFTGDNIIKVSFDSPNNVSSFHFDNTITVLSTVSYDSGQLLTAVDPTTTSDLNAKFSEIVSGETFFGVSGTSVSGPQQITVTYADITNQTIPRSTSYNISTGTTVDRQIFPMDREYYQVITAITVSDYFKMITSSTGQSFPSILNSQTILRLMEQGVSQYRERNMAVNNFLFANFFKDFSSQYVLVLQRGVDPYSPLLENKYNLGVLFGSNYNNPNFDFTIQSRVNIPIQPKQNGQTINNLSTQVGNFHQSKFFTPGNQFSAFTSTTVGYYGAIDATDAPNVDNLITRTFNGLLGIVGRGDFYTSEQSNKKYDNSEDLTGNAFLEGRNTNSTWLTVLLASAVSFVITTAILLLTYPAWAITPALIGLLAISGVSGISGVLGALVAAPIVAASSVGRLSYNELKYKYNSPNSYPDLKDNPMLLSNSTLNVMRTDRLPSSDSLDGASWSANNVALLQQNINFGFYDVSNPFEGFILDGYQTGAEEEGQDIEGQIYSGTVLTSFSCEGMVSLSCYSGFSNTFGVNESCAKNDAVVSGCYVLFTRPLFGLASDLRYFAEWATRYKFFYAMCRGVLSQTFTNNWVNGTLFAFPIQVDTTYNSQNKPNEPKFCKDLVFFDETTNNFYYRSSPYDIEANKFVGKLSTEVTAVNQKNLLFPTTMIDLGYKDSFYSEIMLNPEANAYVMDTLNPTSYSDPSDIINLFVISRILNTSILNGVSLNELFSRNSLQRNKRVDGDLVQMLSTNSQEGVIKFSPEYYDSNTTNSPVGIYGSSSQPVIGIFYSSTTENLQFKDFISPGRVNYRATPTSTTVPVQYNIKTQTVPFYTWGLVNTAQIFGTEKNNWATSSVDIVQKGYQSLDRISDTDFFKAKGLNNDISMRGYIFNVSGDTAQSYSLDYKVTGPIYSNKFIVGAPYHFYFGTVVGATAIEKFKTKYSVDE